MMVSWSFVFNDLGRQKIVRFVDIDGLINLTPIEKDVHAISYMTWLTVTEYVSRKWPRIDSVCRNHSPVISPFTTDFRVCNQSNTMGASRSGLPFRSIWVGSFVHVVKLYVYMCLTLCSDVRYDFRVKTMVSLSLHHLFCRDSCLIYAFCF